MNGDRTHFVVSVGTSVYGKGKEKFKEIKIPDADLLEEGFSCRIDLDEPGAEQSTIDKIFEKNNDLDEKKCIIHLIGTNTRECKISMAYLKHNVYKDRVKDIELHFPSGLGEAKGSDFSEKGLPSLLHCLAKILNKVEEEGHRAFIVPTGGYKAIVPYLTLAGILYKHPAYYIYEGSEDLVKLPAPPLGVHVSDFRPALVIMNNIQGMQKKDAEPYLEALSENMRHLMCVQDGKKEFNAFGERMKKMFQDVPSSTVTVHAAGNTLIRHLGQYKDEFISMTRLGETVWKGDKAPEMADHARFHHVNLLAYSELILGPLLYKDRNFLTSEELFLFLGMVYLHDCGHSWSRLKIEQHADPHGVPLLPTEIRNLHNLLSCQRITDRQFQTVLQQHKVTPEKEYYKLIATLSKYHRKKMPLLSGGRYIDPDNRPVKPLFDRDDLVINGNRIQGSRAALILALFRVIDGMDKQVGRAGDAYDIGMKAGSLLADLPHLYRRAEGIGKSLAQIDKKGKEVADLYFEDIFKGYADKEKVASDSSRNDNHVYCKGCQTGDCTFPTFKSPSSESAELPIYCQIVKKVSADMLPLVWEYLDARVRFFFTAIQPTYYYSDLLLEMPTVRMTENGEYKHITINFKKAEGNDAQEMIKSIWGEICKLIEEITPEEAYERGILNVSLPDAVKVVEGIRDEYCNQESTEVAYLLKENGITIEFQFEGRPVACCQ